MISRIWGAVTRALSFSEAATSFLTAIKLRAGMIAIALVFAGGTAAVGYVKGVWDAGARCETAALKSRIQALEADIANAEKARRDGETRAKAVETRAAFLEQKVVDYEARLAKRPPAARCALTPDDVRSLRAIR